MAKPKQPAPAAKISVECPHCGSKQMEPALVQSVNCRKCGKYYRPAKGGAPVTPKGSGAPSGTATLFKRLTRLFTGERVRTFNCFHCKGEQSISSVAESTMCPHCGVYVDLRDHKIKGVYSRSIETQGTVVVTSRGDLTSSKVVCGNAIVRGKVHGSLICPGVVKIKYDGRLIGAFDANKLVLERGSNTEFVRQVKAGVLEVLGKMSARVSANKILIAKRGILEGSAVARSIEVEKGGIFSGDLSIGQQEWTQTELLPSNGKDVTEQKPRDKFQVKEQKGLALNK